MRGIELRRHIETLQTCILNFSFHSSSHTQAHTQTMLTLGASVVESTEHARTRVIYDAILARQAPNKRHTTKAATSHPNSYNTCNLEHSNRNRMANSRRSISHVGMLLRHTASDIT